MGTVTGYTALRTQEIEDGTIVDGHVDGSGHLILVKHNDEEIDAGLVVGDQGPQGVPGSADPSIVVTTSTTRPTTGLFEGLMIYETDTDRFYFYDGAAWVYRGGFFICTSSTRPSSPFAGLSIFETDTKKIWVYNGTAWELLWLGPKPKGFWARDVTTGTFTVSTTSGQDWCPAAPFDVTFTKRGSAAESYIYARLIWSAYTVATGTAWWAMWAGLKVGATTYWGQVPHQSNIGDCHIEKNDVVAISGLAAGPVTMRARIKKHTSSPNLTVDLGDYFIMEYEEVPYV